MNLVQYVESLNRGIIQADSVEEVEIILEDIEYYIFLNLARLAEAKLEKLEEEHVWSLLKHN